MTAPISVIGFRHHSLRFDLAAAARPIRVLLSAGDGAAPIVQEHKLNELLISQSCVTFSVYRIVGCNHS